MIMTKVPINILCIKKFMNKLILYPTLLMEELKMNQFYYKDYQIIGILLSQQKKFI